MHRNEHQAYQKECRAYQKDHRASQEGYRAHKTNVLSASRSYSKLAEQAPIQCQECSPDVALLLFHNRKMTENVRKVPTPLEGYLSYSSFVSLSLYIREREALIKVSYFPNTTPIKIQHTLSSILSPFRFLLPYSLCSVLICPYLSPNLSIRCI